MKRKHREAMRAHADRQWDYVEGSRSDAADTLEWHEEWLNQVAQEQQKQEQKQPTNH